MKMPAATDLYKPVKKGESALKMRIKEITDTRVHYRRVHVLLRREGHTDNVKRIYRPCREQGLSLRLKRPRRHKAAALRPLMSLSAVILSSSVISTCAAAQSASMASARSSRSALSAAIFQMRVSSLHFPHSLRLVPTNGGVCNWGTVCPVWETALGARMRGPPWPFWGVGEGLPVSPEATPSFSRSRPCARFACSARAARLRRP